MAAAAVCLALVTGCGGDAESPREGTSAEELTGDVSGTFDIQTATVGSRVSLRAVITTVLSDGAFEVRALDAASDQPLLVLNREDALEVGQEVQVVGIVRLFNDEQLATDYGLPAPAEVPKHDGEKIIVATEVDTDVPGDGN